MREIREALLAVTLTLVLLMNLVSAYLSNRRDATMLQLMHTQTEHVGMVANLLSHGCGTHVGVWR